MDYDRDGRQIKLHRCKFSGNNTKQHLSIFFEVFNNRITQFYDVVDVKKKEGCIPCDNLQVLMIPIGEDLESQLRFMRLLN